MDLILDANILMSALIATEGKTYDLIFNERIKLFAPEFLLEEIRKYQEEIILKSNLTKEDFNLFLSILSFRIEIIPLSEFHDFLLEAEKITPDFNDREYFALALKLRCGIWSNDKILKQQKKVVVYSTLEMVEMMR